MYSHEGLNVQGPARAEIIDEIERGLSKRSRGGISGLLENFGNADLKLQSDGRADVRRLVPPAEASHDGADDDCKS